MRNFLKLMVCPKCKGESWTVKEINKQDKIVICNACKSWYICEEGILELLNDEINQSRKVIFFNKHEKKMRMWKVKYSKKNGEDEETKQKKAQMKFFNEFSSEYVLETQNFWRAYYSLFFDEVFPRIKKRSCILDVGCGTGLGSMPFLNKEYVVIGVDISREMVKKATSRIPQGLRQRHYFFVADVENLPFKKELFDSAIGMGIMHHVHNVQKMADAVMKCLKKDGSYFGHENNKTVLRPLFDILMKICTLWHEEAGEEQLLSKEDLQKAFKRCKIKAKTHVFIPPHMLNYMKIRSAKKILKTTDKIASKIPGIRNNGGTIIFEAQKY